MSIIFFFTILFLSILCTISTVYEKINLMIFSFVAQIIVTFAFNGNNVLLFSIRKTFSYRCFELKKFCGKILYSFFSILSIFCPYKVHRGCFPKTVILGCLV